MAQFERELIKERQAEGIAAAKARGRKFGRPSTDADKMDTALRLYQDGGLSVKEICERAGAPLPRDQRAGHNSPAVIQWGLPIAETG